MRRGRKWQKKSYFRKEKVQKAKRSSEEEANGGSQWLCNRDRIQANGLGKSSRKPIDCHLKWKSRSEASIASHSLLPTETILSPLSSCLHGSIQHFLVCLLLFNDHRTTDKIDGLGTKQTNPSEADLAAFPISPKDGKKSRFRRRKWGRLKQRK